MMQKLEEVRRTISGFNRCLVAYSGGVDSTLLALIADQELGDNHTAVIVKAPTLPARELEEARLIADQIGFKLLEMETGEMTLPKFRANTPDRCYACKNHRYQLLREYAEENGFSSILDGSHADDKNDYRPGSRATREHAVLTPLQDAGLTKKEIRSLAKELGLPNWNKPSSACLASRVPYGTPITLDVITAIEQAEEILHSLGFIQLRVRHHGDIARIEVPPNVFDEVIQHKQKIIQDFREIGYSYITLDLEGFRSGSMNQGIKN